MDLSDFHYELPPELIAHYPTERRSDSRLLCLSRESGELRHEVFSRLPDLLEPLDLLVFNDTRVIAARLYGRKSSGGRVEVLIERLLGEREVLARIRAGRTPKAGTRLAFEPREDAGLADAGLEAEVTGREGEFFRLRFEIEAPLQERLDAYGHVPLPPYIRREDEARDRERYQTVYARKTGAVAAPTAGLHFDRPLLDALRKRGVGRGFVTLHVGSGTFQPVRVQDVRQHRMHSEQIAVEETLCRQVRECRERGGRVIGVGTTSVRSLESAAQACSDSDAVIAPYRGETDIFIYPGYRFRVVDAMITNFHLPESTLMLMVSAFAGRQRILAAYREAVRRRYRFFSYGDAMLIA